MKNIIKIDLVLENCECIALNPNDIAICDINKINTYISRVANNSIVKQNKAKDVFIVLCKKANTTYKFFGEVSEDKVFDRLVNCKDITSIDLTYDDNTTESYLVDWNEENDFQNKNQITFITSKENLIISIKQDDDIRRYDNTDYYDDYCELYQ